MYWLDSGMLRPRKLNTSCLGDFDGLVPASWFRCQQVCYHLTRGSMQNEDVRSNLVTFMCIL